MGALETEWRDWQRETDPTLRAAGLLAFAGRLEARDQLTEAAEVYASLASEGNSESGRQAQARLAALEGSGPFGSRVELLLRRFATQASDPKVILPMVAATAVSGLVRAFSYGRLIGWGAAEARLASGALAFSAEVPAFVASGRALNALAGEKNSRSWGQDLASAGLSLASLKIFHRLGQRLVTHVNLPLAPVTTVAGLYQAQWLEETLGLRPRQNGESRLLEALSSYFALNVGARLGRTWFGDLPETWALAQEIRERPWLLSEPHPAGLTRSWAIMGSRDDGAGGGSGEGPSAPKFPSRAAEADAKAYVIDRSLGTYRNITSLTLMGDLLRNLETRAERGGRALRVLDVGSGEGVAARTLKEKLGNRVHVETVDRYPMESGSDRHYESEWKDAAIERDYDVILSIFGAHAHHDGDLLPSLDKALSHLAPGGEMVAALTRGALRFPQALPLRRLENFATMRAGLAQGLALRLEDHLDSYLLYARRLDDRAPPVLTELLRQDTSAAPQPAISPEGLVPRVELSLPGFNTQGTVYEGALRSLRLHLDSLGIEPELREGLAQRLLEDFRRQFRQDRHREPNAIEEQQWLLGEAPSPLWSRSLLIDAFLRSPSLLKKSGAITLALGLGMFGGLPSAEAASYYGEGFEKLGTHPSVSCLVIGALLAIGTLALAARYRSRSLAIKKEAPKPRLDIQNFDRYPILGSAANDVEDVEGGGPYENPGRGFDRHFWGHEMPAGWMEASRAEIESFLSNSKKSRGQKETELEEWMNHAVQFKLPPAEALETVRLLWELTFDTRLHEDFRHKIFIVYRSLLGRSQAFPVGSPQVHREALRLRHIFSEPSQPLGKRVLAADAYETLVEGLDFHSPVGFGEARVGRKALTDFLESGQVQKGTRDYFYVNSARVEIEKRLRDMGILASEEEGD